MLQGRSCSDLQRTAIVHRPTLAFYFSNKCVGLECKCAVPVSALWPKKCMLLEAQLLCQSPCVGCLTFVLMISSLDDPAEACYFLCYLHSDVHLLVVLWPGGLWQRQIFVGGLCNSFCVCRQWSGIDTDWSFLQVGCVPACVCV